MYGAAANQHCSECRAEGLLHIDRPVQVSGRQYGNSPRCGRSSCPTRLTAPDCNPQLVNVPEVRLAADHRRRDDLQAQQMLWQSS